LISEPSRRFGSNGLVMIAERWARCAEQNPSDQAVMMTIATEKDRFVIIDCSRDSRLRELVPRS
jgi:hypothetical protein